MMVRLSRVGNRMALHTSKAGFLTGNLWFSDGSGALHRYHIVHA
jgi:hypothetical protein